MTANFSQPIAKNGQVPIDVIITGIVGKMSRFFVPEILEHSVDCRSCWALRIHPANPAIRIIGEHFVEFGLCPYIV